MICYHLHGDLEKTGTVHLQENMEHLVLLK